MFIGHYSAAFAGKSLNRTIPLWTLFVAVQLLDFFWAIFVLVGIERVRIVPGFMAASALDLYRMPYTHSLAAAVLWSIAGGAVFKLAFRRTFWAGLLVGCAVLSHWILDLIVHAPDLVIYGSRKAGFGLWNYFWPEFALEVALLLGSLLWYFRDLPSPGSKRDAWILFAILIAFQCIDKFGPPPASPSAAAVPALIAYSLLAVLAAWADRRSRPEGAPA